MEVWERKLRDKLELELEDGMYNIANTVFTGKGGYIDFAVEMARPYQCKYCKDKEKQCAFCELEYEMWWGPKNKQGSNE